MVIISRVGPTRTELSARRCKVKNFPGLLAHDELLWRNIVTISRTGVHRVYISDGGNWLAQIESIHHMGSFVVADHIPISVSVQLTHVEPSQKENSSSYFKLNHNVLKQPDAKAEIQRIWEDHSPDCVDPRKKWSQALRQRDVDCSEGEVSELMELERELHDLEEQESSLWYLRIISKWLKEGEAPTKYFFSLAKSRYTKDRIECLKRENGDTVSRREDIIKMIEAYYSELYDAEAEGLENMLVRRNILQLINRTLSDSDRFKMDELPEGEEIDDAVKSLKRGKAPGLDGVTNDFILNCWEFLREDCIKMIQYFWNNKALLHKDSQGFIKLLAKNDEKEQLRNWRPITLMSCTYKLISKVLARRMKHFLPFLIDSDQTGFVPGRRIDDNILTLR
ncbi:hypothetical protein R1sor_026063 [Riccia sorocarpa]|uniref:Reverse transcriptase domain-containing protein n=1 Tax=Riccia sorocarpa TaxID=122646 RepID=A0ABD3GDE6_9MARC